MMLDLYIKDPSEENVHHTRTTIRRLEAAYSVFPKSSRTKRSQNLLSTYKKFFSLNSTIRDYDIILEKLQGYGYGPESRMSMLVRRSKLKRLVNALDLADKLSHSKRPKFKRQDSVSFKFDKRVLALVSDFRWYIPIVTGSAKKIKELHEMRKTTKTLRYLLELYPKYGRLAANLKSLQTLLGDTRDCDIFIRYLEKSTEAPKIVAAEKAKRKKNYQRVVLALEGFSGS